MENEKKANKNSKIKNKNTTHKKGNSAKNNTNNKKKNTNTTNNTKKEKNEKNEVKQETIKEVKVEEEIEVVDKVEEDEAEIVEKIIDKKETINTSETEDNSNKKGVIVLLVILLIIVGICIFYQFDSKKSNNDSSVSSEKSNEIVDNFYKYFNNKKAKIIYYSSSSCGYCKLETPIMEQIDKDYDIDYLTIDSTKLTKTDREKILKELDIEHATPTTLIVKDGEVLDKQPGYVDGGKMVEFLKENKILDKDAVYTPEQYLTFINYEEYGNIINEEGKHVITIGQTGCSHCIATKPVLNSIAKDYNITINYLNITEMNQSEMSSFTNSLKEIGYDEEEFLSTENFGTPLTLIVEKGKVISYINGERPTVQFTKALKKAGVISQ